MVLEDIIDNPDENEDTSNQEDKNDGTGGDGNNINIGSSSKKVTVLDNIKSKKGPDGNVTVDGIYSYNPSASPEDIAASNAPGGLDLKVQDYFPDLGERTLQGTYSGPTIGTVSLFAPGGALTPFTVLDAREKALEAAALKKAKQIDEFEKLYGKAPVTKHSAVQQELNKVYFEALNKWKTAAQKKYGDNWASGLKNDLGFQSHMRDLNTLKEQEDYLVNRLATIEKEVESGKFVATPELQQAINDFRSGVSGLAKGPAYQQGYDLNNSILNLETQYEINKVVDEASKNINYKVGESLGIDPSNPDYDRLLSERTKSVSDKELEDAAKLVQQQFGGRLTKEQMDQILPMLRRRFPGEVEKQQQVAGKRKPEGGGEFQYKETDREDEPIGTNVWVNMGKGKAPKQGEILMEYQYGHKKPIPGFLPQNTKVYLNDEKNGLIPSTDIDPNQEVVYGRTGLIQVFNKPGSPLDGTPMTKDQIKQGLPSRWQAMTQGKIGRGRVTTTVTTPEGEEERVTYKEETVFWTPTKQISNQLVTQRDSKGRVIRGVLVDDVQEEEDRRNKGNKGNKKTGTIDYSNK